MQNNLVGGAVRLHLPSQCLPGVQVHELGERHVLVACASAESVHCLLLPHPVDLWQVSPLPSLSKVPAQTGVPSLCADQWCPGGGGGETLYPAVPDPRQPAQSHGVTAHIWRAAPLCKCCQQRPGPVFPAIQVRQHPTDPTASKGRRSVDGACCTHSRLQVLVMPTSKCWSCPPPSPGHAHLLQVLGSILSITCRE